MTDYAAVLTRNYPDAQWSLNGDNYSGLVWHSDTSKPTKKTLDDAWPQVQYEQQLAAAKAARQARYEAETDPLYFKAMRGDDDVTVDDWKAAVAAIQADLPYPAAPGGDA